MLLPHLLQALNVTCYAIGDRMLIKIARQEAIDKFPIFPLRHYNSKEDDDVFDYPKVFANYILTLPSKSYTGHIELLGVELVSIAKTFGSDKLIFLGDARVAWLKRLNTHQVFKRALQYLADNKIGKRFDWALEADIAQIPVFVKHMAWLVRTNGILPDVYFTDPGQNIIANICQYANLHISTKNKGADKVFRQAIVKSHFTYLVDGRCQNKFSRDGAIKGRSLTV